MIQSLETNSSLCSSTTTECLLLRRVSFENSHNYRSTINMCNLVFLPFVLCVIKKVDVLIKLCWENLRWLSISALPQRFYLLRKLNLLSPYKDASFVLWGGILWIQAIRGVVLSKIYCQLMFKFYHLLLGIISDCHKW